MNNPFINIGYGNIVMLNRVVAVLSPDSAPVKRIIQAARDAGSAVDATYGRRTRAVIICDSGHVVLSPVAAETIAARVAARPGAEASERTAAND